MQIHCNAVLIAEDIFGPDNGAFKGKTFHKKTGHVDTSPDIIPEATISSHINVTIAIDIMLVNGIAFLVFISRHIKFAAAEMLKNQNVSTKTRAYEMFLAPTKQMASEYTLCLVMVNLPCYKLVWLMSGWF